MARQIKKVAVLGAGVMGAGIAAQLTNYGIPVYLLDIVPPKLTDEEKQIPAKRNAFAAGAVMKMKKMKRPPVAFYVPENANLVTVGNFDDDLEKIAECDWIIEVVVENLQIKQSLFEKIEKVRKPGTIISSNTSGIAINKMVEGRSDDFKKNFCVTHFFNPPYFMKLLEMVPGVDTDPEVMKDLAEFGETTLGKGIVWAKDTPNFVANRIGVAGIASTFKHMVEGEYTIAEVDAVTGKVSGAAMPTFKTTDLVGLDTIHHIITNSYAQLEDDETREDLKVPEWLAKLIDNGCLGTKTKKGFYKKEGKKKLVWDWKAMEYVELEKVKNDTIKKAKNTDDPAGKAKTLIGADDRLSQLAWKLFVDNCLYSARRLGEICDDIMQIDNGMKWGYNRDNGPFEAWDLVGVKESVERMKADGYEIPAVVETMLEKSDGSWYKSEGGKLYFWDFREEKYAPVPTKAHWFNLKLMREDGKVVKENGGASLLDMGDGVLCCEFHTKMNAIDDDIIKMLLEGCDLLDSSDKWEGMVVANQGENFSVGANLMMIMMLAMGKDFDNIKLAVEGLHEASKRLRYCSKPTVSAPFGMVLGGGCEVLMATDAVCAHSLSWIGLVEIGAGLIPGGGGNLGLLTRWLENIPASAAVDRFPYIQKTFETIAMATVSNTAEHARDLKFLRMSDRIVANRDDLIGTAKKMVLGMATAGYQPKLPPNNLILPGRPGYSTFEMGLYNMGLGLFVTEHEVKIAKKLANVLTGGDIQPNSAVSEDYLLELETEAFMSLVGEPKSIERMQSLLTTGKPLRN